MSWWRPRKICEEHIKLLKDYIAQCWDEWEELLKWESDSERWSSRSYQHVLKVKLPTYAGFLWFLRRENRDISIVKDTLIDWNNKWIRLSKEKNVKEEDKIYIEFSYSIKELLELQEELLQDWAVSWRYNPVVSKFLLNVNHGYKEVEKKEIEHSWSIDLSDFFDWSKKDNLIKK